MLDETEIENIYRRLQIEPMEPECTDVFRFFNSHDFDEVYESIFEHYVRRGAIKLIGNFHRDLDEPPLSEQDLESAEDRYAMYEYYLARDPGIYRYAVSKVRFVTDLFLLTDASMDELWYRYLPKAPILTPRAESFTRWLAEEAESNISLRDVLLSRGLKAVDGLLSESATTMEIRAASYATQARFEDERLAWKISKNSL